MMLCGKECALKIKCAFLLSFTLDFMEFMMNQNDFNASIDACNAEIESIRNRASQAREKIEDIKPRIIEKQKEVNAFVKDYGSYHFSYTSTEPDAFDNLFDSFFRLF